MVNEAEEGSSDKIMPGLVGHGSNLGFYFKRGKKPQCSSSLHYNLFTQLFTGEDYF